MNDYWMNESCCSNGCLNCVTNYCSNERNSQNLSLSYVSYYYEMNSIMNCYDLNLNDCSNSILTMSCYYASFPPMSWKNLSYANSTRKNLSLNGWTMNASFPPMSWKNLSYANSTRKNLSLNGYCLSVTSLQSCLTNYETKKNANYWNYGWSSKSYENYLNESWTQKNCWMNDCWSYGNLNCCEKN